MKFILFIGLLIFEFIQRSNSTCTEEGLFNNPNDDTCRTYILCFRLSGDIFLQKLYTCPEGTFYDFSMKTCSENYNCIPPTLPTTTVITKGPETFECTAQGRFPEGNDPTCSRYFFCYYLPTKTYIKMNYICPAGTRFDPKLQTCSFAFKCNSQTTTISTISTTMAQESYNCTKQGRFAVEEDETCRSYHYCLYLPSGGYVEYTYLCPSKLKFDPTTQSCSSGYQCPSSTVTSTTQKSTFTCPSSGRFPDDGDTTCKNYFYCIQLPNGDIGYKTYKCPEDLKFDPDKQICSESYKCSNNGGSTPHVDTTTFSILTTPFEEKTTAENSESSTSDIVSTDSITDESSNVTETIDDFSEITVASTSNSDTSSDSMTEICESVGRIADSASDTCESYFLCAMGPNGELINFKYKCADNELFDPDSKICSSSYKCRGGVSTNFPDFLTSEDK